MKLKILIAAFIWLLAAYPAFAAGYADTAGDPALNGAVNMLDSLDIISGGSDGLYHPEQNLTRAQFAKIATYLMGSEENAVSAGVPFVDVPAGHWAMGYIGLVSGSGVIAGYPDGTFGPEDDISWSQALTVVVRVLGYSGEDVGHRWPEGYIEKAQAIGLLDGLTVADYNAPITRGQAAVLFDNALFTDMKAGGELISLRKVTQAEDAVIIADSDTDASLAADVLKTSAGTFKVPENGASVPATGALGDLYIDKDGRIVAFIPDDETVRTLIVTSTFMNTETNEVEINYTENGIPGTESFALNRVLYNEGNALTVGTGYQLMTEGSVLTLYYSDTGSFRRAMLDAATMAGPVIVESESFSPEREFGITDTAGLKVIRKGLTAGLDDIRRFDVLYYNENTNTLYAYADSVTGIYEKAHPIKANVTSITLNGTVYPLATQEAINRLNESPEAFAIGDRVTLLRGRNGEIVGAVDADSADLYGYGVIQNATIRISDDEDRLGRAEYWVTLFMADGTTSDYRCDADYTDNIGELRKLRFVDGVLSLEKINYNVLAGALDTSKPSLAGHWFANDYGIIELVSLPDEGPATLRRVTLSELGVSSLGAAEIIHVQTTGDMGDISILYLRGTTNEQYTYGVVKDVEDGTTARYAYTLLLGADEMILNNNYLFDPGEGVGYGLTKNGDDGFISMIKVGEGRSVEAVTSNRIKVDGTVYTMSDTAVAYGGDYPKNFMALSLDDLTEIKDVLRVTLYSDRSLKNGGTVKVITVETNPL